MKLEFISKQEDVKELCFADIKLDQLFISNTNELCQKINNRSYNIICNSEGELSSRRCGIGVSPEEWKIKRIFDNITGIKITE